MKLHKTLLFVAILSCCCISCTGKPKKTLEERLSWAKELVNRGDKEEAYRIYQEILSERPDRAEALYALGRMSFFDKQYGDAALRLSRYVELRPGDLHAWRLLGRAQLETGDCQGALKSFHKANKIEPERSYVEFEARALMACGRDEEARKILEELMGEDPDDHRAVYFLANLYLKRGDRERAKGLYKEAIRLHPPVVEAYVNLASILFSEGKYREAASLLERTLRVVPLSAPYDPQVRYNLGLCYLEAGETAKAVGNFREYLSLAPQGEDSARVREILEGIESQSTGEAR